MNILIYRNKLLESYDGFFKALSQVVAFLTPLMFMVIRGWTNTLTLILFIFAIIYFCNYKKWRTILGSTREFWFIFFVIAAPFFCELVAQIGRGSFVGKDLDSASRFFLGAVLFSLFVGLRVRLGKIFFLGILLSAVPIIGYFTFFKHIAEPYWGIRSATHVVDPLTFGVYMSLIIGVSVGVRNIFGGPRSNVYVLVSLLSLMHILISTQSRSAFLSILGLSLTYLVFACDKSLKTRFALGLIILLGCLLSYLLSDVVSQRVNLLVQEVYAFLNGGAKDTSIGARMGLAIVDLEIFRLNPLFGSASTNIPPVEVLSKARPEITPWIYHVKVTAGSHAEVLSQISTRGIFGILSFCASFLVPFFWLARNSKDRKAEEVGILRGSLLGISAIFFGSFGIQVFNLKMCATFYAFFLAITLSDWYLKKISDRERIKNISI